MLFYTSYHNFHQGGTYEEMHFIMLIDRMDLPIFRSVLYIINDVLVNISDKFLVFCAEKTVTESIQFDKVFGLYPPVSR